MPLFDGLVSGGEKTAIVIDLGAAYTKCGFAGETGPRFIIPSEIRKPGQQQAIKVVQYNINTEELYAILKEFIHLLYFRHLLVNPRDRRVVIIESILCPSHFRETLTKVFFKQFEVPSVLFAPSHLMAVMTLGINSALVMDCGYTETLVLPVYECTPILPAWEALPLGGKAIHKELDGLLVEQCTVDTDAAPGQSVPAVIGSSYMSILTHDASLIRMAVNYTCCMYGFVLNSTILGPEVQSRVVAALHTLPHQLLRVAHLTQLALLHLPGTIPEETVEDIKGVHLYSVLLRFLINILISALRVWKPSFFPSLPYCTGAIFGALQDILGSRSVSRDYYNQTGRIPDWCCLSSPPPESLYEAGKTPPPLMKRAFSTEK
uniref:Actin related protein 10 n=1 Tax=Tetraodon nigroviridis TaxID=99883 RepID=H3C9R0_TETNG